jgi:hypothetical protein
MQTKFHYYRGHQMCLEVHATQVWNIEQTIMPSMIVILWVCECECKFKLNY